MQENPIKAAGPFQDHDASPRMVKGRSILRLAQRVGFGGVQQRLRGPGNTSFSSPPPSRNDHDERLGPRPYTTIKTSLPFAYIGGKFLLTTAQYDASAISQMSFQAAASIMSSGTDPVSRHAEAAAGYLAADLCAPDPRPADVGLVPGIIQPHRDIGFAGQVSIASSDNSGRATLVSSIAPTSDRRPACAAARDQPRSIKRAGER
jgi:hypothetical protein